MSEFKVGDEVYYVTSDRDCSIQHISKIEIIKDFIDKVYDIGATLNNNNIYLYTTINRPKDEPPTSFSKFYRSKQQCIEAFKKRLDEL